MPHEPPTEQAFLTRQPTRHQERFFVADLHDIVDHAEVHRRRQKVLADTFDFIRMGASPSMAGPEVFVVQASQSDRRRR